MVDEVLFSKEASLGVITLNRPNALNALTLNMILQMQRQLSLWKEDTTVHAVIVRSVPGNAFCAGGDIRTLYYSGEGNDTEQMQFFWHEYRLNHYIHHFSKPYISLMDGIVMGGGVGISMHGSHPVASERFVFAMPETGIGFFPDIGASYLLTRCPGNLGVYLGLTGNRLGVYDALNAGLIKKVVSSDKMPALYDALMNEDLSTDAFERVDQCLHRFTLSSDTEAVSQINPMMEECFKHPTVETIRESLQKSNTEWSHTTDKTLSHKSPLSLKITLAQLQKAKGLSLAECLQMDYTIVRHFMHHSDFYEGVRALLIDKDKNPQWNPKSLDLVTEQMVQEYFKSNHPALELIK